MFYAHSPQGSQADWQPLREHLLNVAGLARGFAAAFQSEDAAYATGLLHDLGKYSDAFQRKLHGARNGVTHSGAGALEAMRRYGPLGGLLAYAIAGHHGGLPDGCCLSERLASETVPPGETWAGEIDLPQKLLPPSLGAMGKYNVFRCAFWLRMLYSCLVDADRLDTARFYGQADASASPGLAALKDRLDAHLAALGAGAAATPVNAVRARVLRECRAAAELPPGLFTLTVPTGGGKTLSSLAFALDHALRHGLRRVIYAIPFTSIIEQNAGVFREALGEEAVLEHHCNVELPESATDEELKAYELLTERWDSQVIVTTNVQLLESLFAARATACRKLHHVARSVIVLDEAQMLPAKLLVPTLAALQELVRQYGCTVVLCTATQPALNDYFPDSPGIREIVAAPQELAAALTRVQAEFAGELDDDALAERLLRERQVLCIVNSRKQARQLYEKLRENGDARHLSALMFPAHRTRVLDDIKAALAAGRPCRVVATQLVEAGVDIDFPVVYRAMAGLDSLAQAAGRCNREGRLPAPGRLVVFRPAPGEHTPRGWLSQTAAIGGSVFDQTGDLLGMGSVHRYFESLFRFKEDELGKRFMKGIEDAGSKIAFPDIAHDYRLIDDATTTVFVPQGEGKALIEAIRHHTAKKGDFRRLQRYGVSLYTSEVNRLEAFKVVERLFPDGPIALMNDDLYDDATGLDTREPHNMKTYNA